MMDVRSGSIHYRIIETPEGTKTIPAPEEDEPYIRYMAIPPTPLQRARGYVGRNDPCPCGSDKKFKRCCRMVDPR
jgi:uncharacterized protein YecA (UPF0149 family)